MPNANFKQIYDYSKNHLLFYFSVVNAMNLQDYQICKSVYAKAWPGIFGINKVELWNKNKMLALGKKKKKQKQRTNKFSDYILHYTYTDILNNEEKIKAENVFSWRL